MIKLALKRYLKNPALLIMSVIYFVFVLYVFCVKNCHEALDPFIVVMGLGQITFLFFMFLSYEYFSEARRAGIEEVIRISYRGLHWFKLSGMVVLMVLDGVVCLLFYLYQIIVISRLGIHNVKYMFFLGTGVIVHHLLAYFFAVILGMVTSYIKSRTKGYCILLLVYFMTSGQMILILHSYFFGKSLSYRIADLLDLFNREFGAIRNFYYIYSMEAVNLQRILFWIFLAGMILVFVMSYGKRKVFTIIPGVGMLICAWLFFQPTSAVNLDVTVTGQDAWTYDMNYYQETVDCMDMSLYREADFKAICYQAEFDIERELSADVAVTVDRGELKKYEFTLYHGYQISQVTTLEGKNMPFTQEGDYVTVTNSSDQVIKGIRFYYKGHCKAYYSTGQGAFLPAYLAYYPMPGRKQVYIVQCGYWGNTVDGLGYEVDYDVKVNINNDLYSNLPVTDGNRVIGRSDGLTILCSPFVSEIKMKECRFIYPSLDMEVLRCDWDKENLNKFFAMFENGIDSLAGKTIIIPPYINGDLYYFGGDHFIGSPGTLEMEYGRYVQTGELYNYSSEEEVLKELEKLEQAGQE